MNNIDKLRELFKHYDKLLEGIRRNPSAVRDKFHDVLLQQADVMQARINNTPKCCTEVIENVQAKIAINKALAEYVKATEMM